MPDINAASPYGPYAPLPKGSLRDEPGGAGGGGALFFLFFYVSSVCYSSLVYD